MMATPARCDIKLFIFGMPIFHSAGALLHQVSCRQVGDVELYSEGIAVVSIAYGKAAAAHGVVKAAHVPADGNGFCGFQAHEMLNKIHALFAVAVGQLVGHLVKRHLLPLAGGIVFTLRVLTL